MPPARPRPRAPKRSVTTIGPGPRPTSAAPIRRPWTTLHPEAVAIISTLQPAGWQEADGGDTLTFWLAEGEEAGESAVSALRRLAALGALEVSREHPGWEDAWRRFHKPRVVGRLYVRPPWYPARDDLLDVVVEAGLAFGTGGHASTRQCLEEIQDDLAGTAARPGQRIGRRVVRGAQARLRAGVGRRHRPRGRACRGRQRGAQRAVAHVPRGRRHRPRATRCRRPTPWSPTSPSGPILRLARRFAPRADGGAPELRPAHLLLAGLLVEQGAQAAAAFPGYEAASRREDDTWLMLHLTRVA